MTIATGLAAALVERIGDPTRVFDSGSVLDQHGEDLTHHQPQRPDAVVYARSIAEVQAVLAFAHEQRLPVVPFGAGSGVEGHVIPVAGGISLDLSQLDRILEVRPDDLLCRVEAGVLRLGLNERLARDGLWFPIDPGADATLGGMAATNASGTTAVRYGPMRHQVLGLTAVLADGTIMHTGGLAVKSSAGYDLTSLLVGSEGTLAVICELTLRVRGIPEHIVAARATFDDVGQACRTAAALIAAGVGVLRCELMDALSLRAVNSSRGTTYDEAPTLFLEVAGSPEGSRADLAFVREVAEAEGARSFEATSDAAERRRLWETRHHAAIAIAASHPGKRMLTTDTAVPVAQMPDAVAFARRAAEAEGVEALVLGHVGDGNYHVLSMIDPAERDEVTRAKRVNAAIVEDALARGGTCSGEHGIGLGKIDYLERERADAMPTMRALKQAFDPRGILNPGKVLRGSTG